MTKTLELQVALRKAIQAFESLKPLLGDGKYSSIYTAARRDIEKARNVLLESALDQTAEDTTNG